MLNFKGTFCFILSPFLFSSFDLIWINLDGVIPCPDVGHPGLPLEPGLVAGPVPMGLGRAKPEHMTWVPLPMGSPPMGGAKGVGCIVSEVAAEGGGLGGLIVGY